MAHSLISFVNGTMEGVKRSISYSETGYFTPLILDYLAQEDALRPFFVHSPDWQGIAAAMDMRSKYPNDRSLLVDHLHEQYKIVTSSDFVQRSIASLAEDNTFTVCTAHQPSLFTGNLYFIYKIVHVIVLARKLKERYPEKNFVPVFWMGSEDADLDELGSFYLGKEKIRWDTKQTGAVGKMKTKGLEALIRRVEGELGVLPHGKELVDLLIHCYSTYTDIQSATFALIHELFGSFGLVVLIPDTDALKSKMQDVFKDDLLRQIPSAIVEKSIASLSGRYKIQAQPRPINLFYMIEGVRNRIERSGLGEYHVTGTDIRFSEDQFLNELKAHPGRFSPNVILRGLYQEMLLPNILFVGGGGEMAYWLELKALFEYYKVPYPVLVLRNSFLLIPYRASNNMKKLGLSEKDLFLPEQSLLNRFAREANAELLSIEREMEQLELVYRSLQAKATSIDSSLQEHVQALQTQASRRLNELGKKMLRAERKKHATQQQQLHALKEELFPLNGLQERVENFMPYYAFYGKKFIELIFANSNTVEHEMIAIHLNEQ